MQVKSFIASIRQNDKFIPIFLTTTIFVKHHVEFRGQTMNRLENPVFSGQILEIKEIHNTNGYFHTSCYTAPPLQPPPPSPCVIRFPNRIKYYWIHWYFETIMNLHAAFHRTKRWFLALFYVCRTIFKLQKSVLVKVVLKIRKSKLLRENGMAILKRK